METNEINISEQFQFKFRLTFTDGESSVCSDLYDGIASNVPEAVEEKFPYGCYDAYELCCTFSFNGKEYVYQIYSPSHLFAPAIAKTFNGKKVDNNIAFQQFVLPINVFDVFGGDSKLFLMFKIDKSDFEYLEKFGDITRC